MGIVLYAIASYVPVIEEGNIEILRGKCGNGKHTRPLDDCAVSASQAHKNRWNWQLPILEKLQFNH
jgi:hypothetical protein